MFYEDERSIQARLHQPHRVARYRVKEDEVLFRVPVATFTDFVGKKRQGPACDGFSGDFFDPHAIAHHA
jgi:hypothetical protein